MIEPSFLASLRKKYRSEMVLVLVQLEQIVPGWWQDLQELAELLGTDRATLNRSIRHLEKRGLIARTSYSNCGGTWIWWCARNESDAPNPVDEPAWVLRDIKSRVSQRVTISGRWAWADKHGIPRGTMSSFLHGYQRILRNRWEITASPLDLTGEEFDLAV